MSSNFTGLKNALSLAGPPRIAFVGSGGKTTAMFQLAREYPPPVIVSVTSHLGLFQTSLADVHYSCDSAKQDPLPTDIFGVTLFSGPRNNRSVFGLEADSLHRVLSLADKNRMPLFIESDGSRRHPAKAPAEHEPPIPDFVEAVIVVAGLSALGKACTNEWVHHPEIYTRLSAMEIGQPITIQAMQRVLCHPQGGLKNIPPQAKRIALLNQADTPNLRDCANELAAMLLPAYDRVVIASLNNKTAWGFQPSMLYIHEIPGYFPPNSFNRLIRSGSFSASHASRLKTSDAFAK